MRIHLLESPDGDWVGMYIDGKLVCEGHSLDPTAVIRELRGAGLDLALSMSEMTEDDIEAGCCPAELGDRPVRVVPRLRRRPTTRE